MGSAVGPCAFSMTDAFAKGTDNRMCPNGGWRYGVRSKDYGQMSAHPSLPRRQTAQGRRIGTVVALGTLCALATGAIALLLRFSSGQLDTVHLATKPRNAPSQVGPVIVGPSAALREPAQSAARGLQPSPRAEAQYQTPVAPVTPHRTQPMVSATVGAALPPGDLSSPSVNATSVSPGLGSAPPGSASAWVSTTPSSYPHPPARAPEAFGSPSAPLGSVLDGGSSLDDPIFTCPPSPRGLDSGPEESRPGYLRKPSAQRAVALVHGLPRSR